MVLKELKALKEELAKVVNEKTVNSKFVETDIEEEDWSDRKLNIYFTEDMKETGI